MLDSVRRFARSWRQHTEHQEVQELSQGEEEISWQDNDPEHPFNWSLRRKWILTTVACLTTFLVGWNALSISSAASSINDRFGISDEQFPNSYWTITAWSLGAGIGPVAGLPLLEDFGLRTGYLLCYALFVAFVIPQALAQNYATLIVCRFFAGGFGSIVQNAIENIIANMWPGTSNSLPVTLYIGVYLTGLTIGPVIGSAILYWLEWRWIFYIQIIIYAALLPVLWFVVEETRESVILSRRARKVREETGRPVVGPAQMHTSPVAILYTAILRPLQLFVTEPVVTSFCLWGALGVGNIFLATQSIEQVYSTNYGFSEIASGYVQGALVVGELIGVTVCLAQDNYYVRSASRNQDNPGKPIPEARLPFSIPASFLGFAGGLFMYAWTSRSWLHWILPTIRLGLVGVGSTVIVQSAATYLTDAYGIYAASVIAAAVFTENIFAAFLPLAAQRMYSNLGFQWASSLLALIALVLSFAPVILWWKGPMIRKRSRFMAGGMGKDTVATIKITEVQTNLL